MGRILALDYGRKRIGLAVTDEDQIAIRSLPILNYASSSFWETLVKLILEMSPDLIVLGYPYSEREETTNVQKEIQNFRKHLEKICSYPVVYHDESHTSEKAMALLIEISGKKRGSRKQGKKRKDTLDSRAASLLLKSYLSIPPS
jgi:putative Holliday junction resolvase